MPTGYTQAIEEGISFKDFIMSCARAFGALVSMRDEAFDAEIPEKFEPSVYYKEQIEDTREKLRELDSISIKEAENKAKAEYQREKKNIEKRIEEKNKLKEKYTSMLSKVKRWRPPTANHVGLKDFMINQIEESIKFDCSINYIFTELRELKLLTAQQWIDKEYEYLLQDLNYYTERGIEERSRIEGRNNWLKELRNSIKDFEEE